jgi:hypothetical protein
MVNPRRATRGLASCEWLEFSDSKNWPGHQGSAPTFELVKKMGMIWQSTSISIRVSGYQYQYQSISYNSILHIR